MALSASGQYEYRLIKGGIGHNLPQEAPQAFAQAVIDVDLLSRAMVEARILDGHTKWPT
jgi:hypothetical protein